MKKVICILLAAMLLCSVIAGCTKPTATPAATEPATNENLEDPDITNATIVDYGDEYSDSYAEHNQSLFGWENDVDAPIAYLDGSFKLRDRGEDENGLMIRFGVGKPDSLISWYNAENYLPCLVSEYEKNGLQIKIENFADKITVYMEDFVIAYSRVTMTNTNDTVINLPVVSEELIPLKEICSRQYISPGETIVKEYAIGADRFGHVYDDYPSDEEIAALGSWQEHYDNMKSFWEEKTEGLFNVTQIPEAYQKLVYAYKSTFIYSLIVNDNATGEWGVDSGYFTINVGENGYDGQWNHDAIGIVANYLTLGYTDNFLEYAELLYSGDTDNYSDARMKYVWNFALYAMKTGDAESIRPYFADIQQTVRSIMNLRVPYNGTLLDEDGNVAKIMGLSNSIDSDGHWLIDNWSGLFGLAAYKYLCDEIYEATDLALYKNESDWAVEQQTDFIKSLNAVLNYLFETYDFEYLPISLDVPNDQSVRSDPKDANWGAAFMFGRWAWDGYLFGAVPDEYMTSLIDKTYEYCLNRLQENSGYPDYTAGGYPGAYYSTAYNAAYGSAALRGEEYRDWAIKAYQFMVDNTMSGPYSWWESICDPLEEVYWDVGYNITGQLLSSCPHMWGQSNSSKVFIDALISERFDDTLIIGRGIPNEFVYDGETVAFENYQYGHGNTAGCTITTSGNTITVTMDLTLDYDVSIEIPALVNNIADANGLEYDNEAGTVFMPAGTNEATITLSVSAEELDAAAE